MSPQGFERKLTAILSADVAGYSRLMGADEDATLGQLNRDRGLIDGLIADHRGRVVSTAGDGLLAEFASPVEAVRCAAAIQLGIEERAADHPEDRRMRWRIGVNLGDVMVAGDDIYGNGVNVAARLQSLAEEGGVCVSAAVHDQVGDKLPFAFQDLGQQTVKNIAKPVRAYRVVTGAEVAPTRHREPPARVAQRRRRLGIAIWVGLAAAVAAVAGGLLLRPAPAPTKQTAATVAVLPFRTIGGGPTQQIFSAGLSEDLMTALAETTGLKVIAAADGEDGQAAARRVGQALKARYVLGGSVREANGRVRITAQLIDAKTGYHLWGGRYDRMRTDELALQDEVTRKIVASMAAKLTEGGDEAAPGTTTYLVLGLEYLGRVAKAAVDLPQEIYRRITDGDDAA